MWGKYLANAILNNMLMGLVFSPVLIKLLYGYKSDRHDLLKIVDPLEAQMYLNMLKYSDEEIDDLCLDFTYTLNAKKGIVVELKPDGAEIAVRKDNVIEYLDLIAEKVINDRYHNVIEAMRKGFNSVICLNTIKKWIN